MHSQQLQDQRHYEDHVAVEIRVKLFRWLSDLIGTTGSPGATDGVTVEKVADDVHVHHVSSEKQEEWANERRRKDRFGKVISQDGFHICRTTARGGTIYSVYKQRVCDAQDSS